MTPLPVGKVDALDPYCGCGGEGHDGPCYGPKYSRIRATYSGDPIAPEPIEPPDRWQTDIAVVIVAIIVLLVIAGLASLSVAR